jgi:hypothetical protein
VLIYCVAGGLVALPERAWDSLWLGRAVLGCTGLFLAGMAVLQAWPGRGFWQGSSHRQPGTLAGMTQTMARTPQPGFLSSLISGFTAFDEAHGFAVNLTAVIALTVMGAAFLTGQPRLIRPAVIAFTVLCLADWMVIEDLGFLGGLGTDPNSMIPMVLLVSGGYLALARVPAPADGAAAAAQPAGRWRDLARPASLRSALARASFGSIVAAGAAGLIVQSSFAVLLADAVRQVPR